MISIVVFKEEFVGFIRPVSEKTQGLFRDLQYVHQMN